MVLVVAAVAAVLMVVAASAMTSEGREAVGAASSYRYLAAALSMKRWMA